MTSHDEITDGAWSARWGDWMIFIRGRLGRWAVVVWHLPHGASMQDRKRLGAATSLDNASLAVSYACDILRRQGVRVFVSGKPQPVEKFLSFYPAPSEVP